MEFEDFEEWCQSEQLYSNVSIAVTIGVSAQTVRNWKDHRRVPHWVKYACVAISKKSDPIEITVQNLKSWQHRNNLKTYEDTGRIFRLKRQAVHQWFRRGKFPGWLGLATRGYELEKLDSETANIGTDLNE